MRLHVLASFSLAALHLSCFSIPPPHSLAHWACFQTLTLCRFPALKIKPQISRSLALPGASAVRLATAKVGSDSLESTERVTLGKHQTCRRISSDLSFLCFIMLLFLSRSTLTSEIVSSCKSVRFCRSALRYGAHLSCLIFWRTESRFGPV